MGWYKVGWLAIRSEDVASVLAAVGVQPTAAAGAEARERAWDDLVAVFGPVDGWTILLGSSFLDAEVDVVGLSDRLATEVQLFRTHRVVDAYEWHRATSGTLERSYRYLGESDELDVVGEATAIERALGIIDRLDDDRLDGLPEESLVNEIAAAWSVDPDHVESQDPAPSFGTLDVVGSRRAGRSRRRWFRG